MEVIVIHQEIVLEQVINLLVQITVTVQKHVQHYLTIIMINIHILVAYQVYQVQQHQELLHLLHQVQHHLQHQQVMKQVVEVIVTRRYQYMEQ